MELAAGEPPINEVVLSISFSEQELLEGPKLLIALGSLRSRYPELDEHLAYEMPEERPTRSQVLRPNLPRFEFVGPMEPTKRRYWLTAKGDKSLLVQAQADYFAINWRAKPDNRQYPGFESLKKLFFDTYGLFRESLVDAGASPPEVRQVELSYINLVEPSGADDGHSSLMEVLDLRSPILDDFEQLTFTRTRALHAEDSTFFGRSYVAVQTGYQATVTASEIEGGGLSLSRESYLKPVLTLTTSVRSAKHKSLSLDEVAGIFDREHAEATRSFRAITSSSARSAWGV